MAFQDKLVNDKDEFVESLELTPEKIREDLEKMRDIEGFPIGDVEDILELSDPPYYTAYPNPYIKDFIEMYGTPYDEETDEYNVEPFVGDVSEGKNDAVYNAHAYSTKVPYKAIKKFIEHYTEPGDIVFDGFCGTGMTGVAAGSIDRIAILNDLSPMASFISYNYNQKNDPFRFRDNMEFIIEKLKDEVIWMYETKHTNGAKGIINSVVWSNVYQCPQCNKEFIFWDLAVHEGKVHDNLKCQCNAKFRKKDCKNTFIDYFDTSLSKNIDTIKQMPVEINYTYKNKRYTKKPDNDDYKILKRIDDINIPFWHPTARMPLGGESRRNDKFGITHIHHFFFKRTLYTLSCLLNLINDSEIDKRFIFTSILPATSKLYRYRTSGGGSPSNNLYVPSLIREQNPLNPLKTKLNQIIKSERIIQNFVYLKNVTTTQSSTQLSNIPKNYLDYIFVDPPFGANIYYSELNFIGEAWLNVFTNNKDESIENKFQNKDLEDYRSLMIKNFEEFFRILKPNRWMTVEFHNSKASVWKTIQESIIKSGFIIAQVAILDKKQGTFNQVSLAGAVKNDLVINAYKPSKSFCESFFKKAGLNMEKEFIEMHLNKLPIEPNVERTQQMLYSKLLAQYIQNGFEVRLDASDFYKLLRENFEERDGYWFNSDQIDKYEQKLKLQDKLAGEDLHQKVLGISDEKSAIIWLAQYLQDPKTYDEIFVEFSKNLLTSDDKIPELKIILEENFGTEMGKYRLPSDIERIEKEDVRDKRLMKEFNEILQEAQSKRKIKEVRKEALLHGLMKLYKEKDVEKIKYLGERLDRSIIDSDDDISAIIDWAMYN